MAKVKKKENLTPEERVQAALVPDWEQPYKVPENWCWTRIANICALSNGKAFKPTDWTKTGIPIVRIQNLNNPEAEYNLYSGVVEDKFKLCGGELLFAWSGTPGSSFGAHIWWGKEAVLNQHIFRIDFDERYINKIFFKYAINQQLNMLISVAHGGAGLQHVTKGVFEATPIPLPPLSEQQRIVDRIESLFSKLDEAKQKAQNALDSFGIRKTAILQRAFNGELTAQWRKEHSVGMESWKTVSVSEICHSLKYGTSKKSMSQGKVVVIRMGNLQDGEISWDDLAYSNDKEDIEKYKLFPGDVLFNRTNSPALVGKTSIYRGDYPAIYAGYLIKLDYDHSRITGDFLNYSLNTISAKEYCNSVKTDGVNQSNINAKKIGAYEFEMPSIEEQIEIVRILDGMFAKEQQVKENVETVLEQIDLIKKAILAHAFRSELGTNDPVEESAVELVKEVIEKSAEINNKPKTKTKRTVIPGEIKSALSNSNEEEIIRLLIKSVPKAVSVQMIMSISKKKFELMDALRSLEQKQIVIKNSVGEYLLKR